MKKAMVLVVCFAYLVIADVAIAQSDRMRKAAGLAGYLAGLARGCDMDGKPILRGYRRAMNRAHLSLSENRELEEAVAEVAALGISMQMRAGIPCTEVKRHVDEAIDTINNLP